MKTKYKIVLFERAGPKVRKIWLSNSWIKCKALMLWFYITGKRAFLMEKLRA